MSCIFETEGVFCNQFRVNIRSKRLNYYSITTHPMIHTTPITNAPFPTFSLNQSQIFDDFKFPNHTHSLSLSS